MTRRFLYLCVAVSVAALALAVTTSGQTRTNGSVATEAATPRTPDGKPDLGGMGRRRRRRTSRRRRRQGQHRGSFRRAAAVRRWCSATAIPISLSMASSPAATIRTGRFTSLEHWDKVQQLDMNTNTEDPVFICQPLGLPRVGPPVRILQTANDVVFLYAGGGASTQPADYRVIPTDGRKHDPVRSQDVLLRTLGRPLGGRHARDRVDRVQRSHLARARRVFPLGQDARHRTPPSRGEHPALRDNGGRSGVLASRGS